MRQDLSSSAPLPSRQWRTGVAFNPHRLFFQNSRSPPPFLGKRSRLALAALSPTFLSIFILLVSVAIPLLTPGASPIETRIDQAKDRLTAACAGVQAAVGAIQGVPHYMAQGTNRMIANGIEFTVSSLGHLLMLLIYATEKVLIYIVDTYRSLLQCLIELLIRGVLAILVQVVQILSEGINSASLGIKSAVQAAVSSVNTVISSALTGINDVLRIVGKSVQVPQINVPDLSALDNIHLPTFFQDGLVALNNSIPTLDAIKDKMNSVIAMPLEAARTDVNKTINAFTFDRSVLDVPPLPGTALPVCNASTIAAATKPLDDLAHAVHKLELGLLVGLLLAMLIVALCTVALEWWAWRSMWRHIRLIREICGRDQARDDHPLQQQPLSTSAASLPMTSSKAAEAKAEEASHGVQRRYADGQPARQVNEFASSYWLNAPDAQDEQLAAHDGSYGHQQVTFSAPTRRAASDQPAQSSPLDEAAHAAAGAQSNTQPPASTRFVVVSDHCIELPAHPSPSPKRARLDPLASDRGTLDLVHLVHHPLATSLSLRLASTLRVQRAQTLDALRWFFGGWLGHPGMIALLAFAVFGALSTQIHILALQHIAKEYDGRLYGSLNDASSGIRQQLQDSFVGQSVAYANQVNNQIQVYENRINQNVFGWVNTTTGTMNNTLNEFVDMVNEAISDIFNNTILYSPVQNFLQCILLRKIEGIESALTWIQQNAQVSLARANADILTLDAGGMDDLMSPITRLGAQVGSDGTGPSTSTGTMPTVARIVSGQLESLRRQRDLFLLMLAAWIVLALAGFVWMVARMRARERVPPNVYHQPTEKGMPIGEEDGYEMSEIECEDSSTNLTRLPTSRVGTWRERFQHRRTQSLGRYR